MASKARGVSLVASGHSRSLFNGSLSPGWTREECDILRLAIMKIGVGGWKEIIESGCLPGKTPSQLNLQTQRLCGQQSIGEFLGIRLDPIVIFEENAKKTDVVRKNGCIINTGNNPTKEERQAKITDNRKKYTLPQEQSDAIQLPDRRNEMASRNHSRRERLRQLKERLEFLEALYEQRMKNAPTNATVDSEGEEGGASSNANGNGHNNASSTKTGGRPPLIRRRSNSVAKSSEDDDSSTVDNSEDGDDDEEYSSGGKRSTKRKKRASTKGGSNKPKKQRTTKTQTKQQR